MAVLLSDFSKWFWNPKFWLPANATWEDLIPENENEYFPRFDDMFLPSLGLGICLLMVRFVYARLVVYPTGRYFGIKEPRQYKITKNPVLEEAYKESKSFDTKRLLELSKKTSLTERQIQRWVRIRLKQDAPSLMKKYEDSCWHFLFYIILFWYGLYTLWDKPWFSKTINCWIGWPKQHITSDVYWYYAIELGFYWSLLFTLSTDHKRKDFTEMVTHHLVTVALIFFSWVVNFVRVGTLVLCVHDAVDYFLAGAKIAGYVKKETLSTVLFVVFLLVWIATRLTIFPFYVQDPYSIKVDNVHHKSSVIYCASVESATVPGLWESPTHMFFNGLLYILQVLHIIWSYMIFRIAYRKVTQGQVRDIRSDNELDSEDDEEHEAVVTNGNGPRQRSKGSGDQ